MVVCLQEHMLGMACGGCGVSHDSMRNLVDYTTTKTKISIWNRQILAIQDTVVAMFLKWLSHHRSSNRDNEIREGCGLIRWFRLSWVRNLEYIN